MFKKRVVVFFVLVIFISCFSLVYAASLQELFDYFFSRNIITGRATTCSADIDCTGGQFCNYYVEPVVCSDPQPNGQRCGVDKHCQSNICDKAYCVAERAKRKAGESCYYDTECETGLNCGPLQEGYTGICCSSGQTCCGSNYPCSSGYSCVSHNYGQYTGADKYCELTCTNDCSSGAKECSGSGYRTCGNNDDDPCLEWSSETSCSTGEECKDGSCVKKVEIINLAFNEKWVSGRLATVWQEHVEYSFSVVIPAGITKILLTTEGSNCNSPKIDTCGSNSCEKTVTPGQTLSFKASCWTTNIQHEWGYLDVIVKETSKKNSGQSCSSNNDCLSGNCKNSVCCEAGKTCCSSSTQCSTGYECSTGYYCTLKQISKKANGLSCTANTDCQSNNCKNNLCCSYGKTCCSSSTQCGLGYECSSSYYCAEKQKSSRLAVCAANSDCASGNCYNNKICCNYGEKCCSANSHCESEYDCVSNICKVKEQTAEIIPAKKSDGDSCIANSECDSGNCNRYGDENFAFKGKICCAYGKKCCARSDIGGVIAITDDPADYECSQSFYLVEADAEPTTKSNGQYCASNNDCSSGWCDITGLGNKISCRSSSYSSCDYAICCSYGKKCCSQDGDCIAAVGSSYRCKNNYCQEAVGEGGNSYACETSAFCRSGNCMNKVCCEAGKRCCTDDSHCLTGYSCDQTSGVNYCVEKEPEVQSATCGDDTCTDNEPCSCKDCYTSTAGSRCYDYYQFVFDLKKGNYLDCGNLKIYAEKIYDELQTYGEYKYYRVKFMIDYKGEKTYIDNGENGDLFGKESDGSYAYDSYIYKVDRDNQKVQVSLPSSQTGFFKCEERMRDQTAASSTESAEPSSQGSEDEKLDTGFDTDCKKISNFDKIQPPFDLTCSMKKGQQRFKFNIDPGVYIITGVLNPEDVFQIECVKTETTNPDLRSGFTDYVMEFTTTDTCYLDIIKKSDGAFILFIDPKKTAEKLSKEILCGDRICDTSECGNCQEDCSKLVTLSQAESSGLPKDFYKGKGGLRIPSEICKNNGKCDLLIFENCKNTPNDCRARIGQVTGNNAITQTCMPECSNADSYGFVNDAICPATDYLQWATDAFLEQAGLIKDCRKIVDDLKKNNDEEQAMLYFKGAVYSCLKTVTGADFITNKNYEFVCGLPETNENEIERFRQKLITNCNEMYINNQKELSKCIEEGANKPTNFLSQFYDVQSYVSGASTVKGKRLKFLSKFNACIGEALFNIPRIAVTMNEGSQHDLDLHTIDEFGRHVGMNYETGEYEIQIPGAYTAYDQESGMERIYIPSYIKATYYVDSIDALENKENYEIAVATIGENGIIESEYKQENIDKDEAKIYNLHFAGENEAPKIVESSTNKIIIDGEAKDIEEIRTKPKSRLLTMGISSLVVIIAAAVVFFYMKKTNKKSKK